jgi:uncharacterized protein (DUF2235 family)
MHCSYHCRDTVASVGVIPRSLPFVSTNNNIRFFRHALALDERRVGELYTTAEDMLTAYIVKVHAQLL